MKQHFIFCAVFFHGRRRCGMTMMEILVTLALLAILAGAATVMHQAPMGNAVAAVSAKSAAARCQALDTAKQVFRSRVADADAVWAALGSNDAKYAALRAPDGSTQFSYLPMAPASLADYIGPGFYVNLTTLYDKCVLTRNGVIVPY
ncbi:prepilin-type N-terminal cleavage/methylation domain-containing protein [Termitidicoccus mucosus]|uniref:Prepilin-type N-terminal cleavage/methylation domain-containing protein n=1 Tax=Termitidicoccus mucosus TaxID=1184151 RepID=A0A178IQL1_9BACT|nr:hypothetical protein AW736_02540 [Opitutaceae bacterium TSB47]